MRSIQQDGTDIRSGAPRVVDAPALVDVSLIGLIHRVKRRFAFREIVFA
jgi:hypothetical protein